MTLRICITGPDGCGKSAVVQACDQEFQRQGRSTQMLSIWDALPTQGQFKSQRDVLQYIAGLSGWSRVHFLQHGLAILSDLIDASHCDIVLVDAYWYKYFLTESAHQPQLPIRESLFSHLTVLDQVIYLKTPLQTILNRKQRFGPYESGGLPGCREHFTAFQAPLHQKWDALAEQNGWQVISGIFSPCEIAQSICERMQIYA